jgi:CHAT domain-containing protein
LEEELGSRSVRFRQHVQPVTISAVQAALPADSALVEFALFTPRGLQAKKTQAPRYLAYLLPAQGRPKWVDLGEASKIDRAVAEWRNALRNPRRPPKQLARIVDDKLMRPVRSLLKELPGQTLRLIIAPDDKLNLIPFAALVDEQNKYLVERYTISYLTSGRDLLRLQKSEKSKSGPLLVANPDYGRFTTLAMNSGAGKPQPGDQAGSRINRAKIFFQPLPATMDEAFAIKTLLPNASLVQKKQATETVLKQVIGPQILHIATHGFFLDYQESSLAEDEKAKGVPQAIAATASAQAVHYTIQLEATPMIETAQERMKQLIAQGVDAYILKRMRKGTGVYRVRAGNFFNQAEAQKYGVALQERGITGEFFVAPYEPPQRDLEKPEATIAGATTKNVSSTSETASPVTTQHLTEMRSDLRLNSFAARVKDPLLRSGLALAGANEGRSGDDDGVLTAQEAAYLDLLGTKLVVLSACDTGVGVVKSGEGVQGLRRALVLAGSESQVMSLWPVSDKATKDLMIPYYKALQRGEGRSEGLRQVQLQFLRGGNERRHPFYWAAFIQSGEWANLDGQR